jgi:peroxiredoxin
MSNNVLSVEVGDKAPAIKGFGYDFKPISQELLSGKNVVLAFFPGAFTGICTNEVCALRDAASKLNELDAQVIGISVDSPFANKAWAEKNAVTFPVFSDFARELMKEYNVLFENFAGLPGYTVAQRSIFIIDKNGIVRYKWLADNPGIEPNYQEIESEIAKLK